VEGNLAEVAYAASLRRLDKQEQLLDELRARTGLLLAAASLTASFLGTPALDADPIALAVLAFTAFAVAIGACLYVLVPKKTLVFALIGSRVYEELFEFRNDVQEVYRRLAYDLDRFWVANDRLMQRVLLGFRTAAWALSAEVVFLLASAADILG
jgi:hypothetical protein